MPGRFESARSRSSSLSANIHKSSEQRKILLGILAVLEHAHPPAKTDLRTRIVEGIQKFAKYIGLPTLIIAAILPVYNLLVAAVDHRNTSYIKHVYIDYALKLSERHLFDRSIKVLRQLDKISSLDANAQHISAKISAEAAYFQGRAYDEVEDSIIILLALHEKRPVLFPTFGGDAEILELEQRLVDIHLKRGKFREAVQFARDIRAKNTQLPLPVDARLTIQEAKGHLYAFDMAAAKPLIARALQLASICVCRSVEAEAEHALGTLSMFSSASPEAEKHLKVALSIFEAIGDREGQVRTWTNLAVVYGHELDWKGALGARRQQERIAREMNDEQLIANALVGLAVVERNLGNFERALSFALEAQAIANRLGSSISLAAALVNKANIYVRMKDYANALDSANSALPYFVSERDLRGVTSALGIIAQAGEDLGDNEALLFGLGGSIGLARHLGQANASTARDLNIHIRTLERFKRGEPLKYELTKINVAARLRELERSLRTPSLSTGVD